MDTLTFRGDTQCLMKAVIAAGTTSTLTTTGVTQYKIRGKSYSKAALTNQATPTLDATTGIAFVPFGPNQGTVVVVGFDSGGNLKAAQGTIRPLDQSGAFLHAPEFPAIPQTMCPIGYIILKAGATASAFTFGTSNLSGVTGLTYTFVDVGTLPERPQVA